MFKNIPYKFKKLSIPKKVSITIILLFVFLVVILYLLFSTGMQTMLSARESDVVKTQVQQSEKILLSSVEPYPNIIQQWAVWDNTYEFVRGNFDEFIEYHLNDYPYQTYDLDFIAVLNPMGEIIYERFYPADATPKTKAPIDLTEVYRRLSPLTMDNAFTQEQIERAQLEGGSGLDGFIKQDGKLLYLTSHPILTQNDTKPPVGTLVFGKMISDHTLSSIANDPNVTFSIDKHLHNQFTEEQDRLLHKNEVLIETNKKELTAYIQAPDLFGENTLLLCASSPRILYQESIKFIGSMLAVIASCCAAILFAVIKAMGAIILNPFSKLVTSVNNIDLDSLTLLPISDREHPEFILLEESINNMLTRIRLDRDDIEKRNEMLYYNAHFDSLTGLHNWFSTRELLINKIENAKKKSQRIGLYFLDIDRFKFINNTLGYDTGNQFIIAAAQQLKEGLPKDAIVGRIRGDKFMVVAGGFHERHEIHLFADKIFSLFEQPLYANGIETYLTISAGSCSFPEDGGDADTLFKNAEIAMYRAKELGNGLYCRYEIELQKVLQQKLYIENKIRAAVNSGCKEFQAYFQPKVLTSTDRIVSCEALVRWVTLEGVIGPNSFIPLAEESGLIVPLSWWMLKESFRCAKLFESKGIDLDVSVNISAQVLLHKDFIDVIKRAAAETGMDVSKLDIEITEATLIHDILSINEVLATLHELGITISIDDFGTGYSSLSYLQKLAVDRIKIDRSFIVGINDNEEDRSIVNAIIAMAKSLHMIVTAEGVEDARQYAYLKSIQCDEIQGYFASKPLPYEDYITFHETWYLHD